MIFFSAPRKVDKVGVEEKFLLVGKKKAFIKIDCGEIITSRENRNKRKRKQQLP